MSAPQRTNLNSNIATFPFQSNRIYTIFESTVDARTNELFSLDSSGATQFRLTKDLLETNRIIDIAFNFHVSNKMYVLLANGNIITVKEEKNCVFIFESLTNCLFF